jgi:hypothetical protein
MSYSKKYFWQRSDNKCLISETRTPFDNQLNCWEVRKVDYDKNDDYDDDDNLNSWCSVNALDLYYK